MEYNREFYQIKDIIVTLLTRSAEMGYANAIAVHKSTLKLFV